MPKQVDHEQRRRHIADAVLQLLASRGPEAASLRNVAAAAGVSMGAVQHYFKTKQEMLEFALARNHELLTERVQKAIADTPPTSTLDTFRTVLLALLPLDDDARDGARLGAAILALGAVDDKVAENAQMAYQGVTDFFARHLQAAVDAGELRADLDVVMEARYLNSVIEGLRWPTLFDIYTAEQATAVLDEHLRRLFAVSS